MGPRAGGKVAVGVVEAPARPDGSHGRAEPRLPRGRVVRRRGRHHRQTEFRGEVGERIVVVVIGRDQVPGQFDGHVVRAETVDEAADLASRPIDSVAPPVAVFPTVLPPVQGAPHCSLATPGEDQPVSAGCIRERVEIVDRAAFLTTGQVRIGELPRQPPVAFLASSQHQQVLPDRVGFAELRSRQTQREFRPVQGFQTSIPGGLGELDHAVETVMVGDGERIQVQP